MEVYTEVGPPTSVFRIPNASPDSPLLFFVPGNPGLAEYYIEYLQHVHEQLPDYDIFCPSHVGFNTLDDNQGRLTGHVYTLDEQIDHKVRLLKHLAGGSSRRQVVIMGHSVGAWMIQRVVVQLKGAIDFKLVGLITPTIADIAMSDKGQRITQIGKYVSTRPGSLLARIGQGLYWTTPQIVLRKAIEFGMGGDVPKHAVEATARMISRPSILRQFADMGGEEMERIVQDTDVDEFWKGKYKIWMYYVHYDHWVKETTREETIKRYGDLPDVDIVVGTSDDSMAHAFCVRHSEHFAKITTDKIRLL